MEKPRDTGNTGNIRQRTKIKHKNTKKEHNHEKLKSRATRTPPKTGGIYSAVRVRHVYKSSPHIRRGVSGYVILLVVHLTLGTKSN
jgi:hypothetical protein